MRASLQALFELYRAGEYRQLLDQASALLATHPDELALHSLSGAAQLELRDYEAAIASYRKALEISPDFAKAHNGLGVACLRTGQLRQAMACFHEAVRRNPGLAQAWFNLGIVYENARRLTEAAGYFRQASLVDPAYYQAFTALARLLWELRRPEQVEEYFEKALSIKETWLPAHLGLIQFLERSNRHEKLRVALDRARRIEGAEQLVELYEGILVELDGNSQQARMLLENVAIDPTDATTRHQERLRLSRLAQVCDKLEDSRAAVRYAQGANDLSRELARDKGIDKTRFLQFVANRRRYFTADNVDQWQPVRDTQSRRPVFVVGFPRSGTTLLDTMLRGHPAIAVTEESDSVARLVNRLSGMEDERLEALAAPDDDLIERLRQDYHEAQTAQSGSDAAVVVDRFAINIIYAGELRRVFPQARFILMLRHPADCVLSCFLHTFYETSANASFHTLEDSARLYDRVFGLWRQYSDALTLDVCRLRYEDLVTDPEANCRRVLEFLGLDWHPGVLEHEKTAADRTLVSTASYNQVNRPLYTTAINRWQRYRHEMETVLPVLAPWISYFGYQE